MPEWEHFPRAPIVEALLDVQVTFPASVEPARLEAFHDAIRAEYPVKAPRVRWRTEVRVSPADASQPQQEVKRESEGFMFKSQDRRRAVQARQDGYTFNWLAEYPGWSTFSGEARQHWERYRDTFRPVTVTRLGLRYINRLELPLPFDDFRDFVKTAPDIARDLPQGLSAMFMRLEIPDDKRHLVAIITETIQLPDDEGRRLPFIFDIDVVRAGPFEPDSPSILQILEDMRDYKNEIFSASVTDRAKALFR